MPYTHLSFDLDGTLVDTAEEIAEAVNRTLAEFGVAARPLDEIKLLIGGGAHELMRRLIEQIQTERSAGANPLPIDDVLARLDDHYAETAGTTGLPYADCVDSLRRLRVAGLRLVCLTNKEERFARRVLQQTRLDGYFELLIGGDTLVHKKPHASVISHVLQQLGGRAEHFAHIGDSRTDVETARNASVAAWAVPYGYNAGEPIAAAQPDVLFANLAAVVRHVIAANASQAAPAPPP
jgi:phosphoglycolate phosphatase